MIWSMPIQAYYLLQAGISREVAARILGNAWITAQGDENYWGQRLGVLPLSTVGPYAMPSEWRTPAWPDGKPKLIRDSEIIAHHVATDKAGIWEAYPYSALIPDWVQRAVTESLENPQPGYTSPLAYAQARINPAFLNQ